MRKFELFAGMKNVGTVNSKGVFTFDSKEDALIAAFSLAYEIYQFYVDIYNLPTWDDALEQAYKVSKFNDRDLADIFYSNMIKRTVEYYVIEREDNE